VFPLADTALTLVPFLDVAGFAPTQITDRKPQQTRVEAGSNDAFAITLTTSPQRADIVISPKASTAPPTVFQFLGSIDDAMRDVLQLGLRWLPTPPDVHRVAIGLVVGKVASSKREAVSLLLEKSPAIAKSADDLLEFELITNRPRKSRVAPDILLNRYARWQVVQTHVFEEAKVEGSVASVVVAKALDVARALIDVSTLVTNSRVRAEFVVPLFREMCELAREIADKGDVP
jgi:hypothetical protein